MSDKIVPIESRRTPTALTLFGAALVLAGSGLLSVVELTPSNPLPYTAASLGLGILSLTLLGIADGRFPSIGGDESHFTDPARRRLLWLAVGAVAVGVLFPLPLRGHAVGPIGTAALAGPFCVGALGIGGPDAVRRAAALSFAAEGAIALAVFDAYVAAGMYAGGSGYLLVGGATLVFLGLGAAILTGDADAFEVADGA